MVCESCLNSYYQKSLKEDAASVQHYWQQTFLAHVTRTDQTAQMGSILQLPYKPSEKVPPEENVLEDGIKLPMET